jgi:hypothetical protein
MRDGGSIILISSIAAFKPRQLAGDERPGELGKRDE